MTIPKNIEQRIYHGVKEEMLELVDIEQTLGAIKEKMLEKVPSHFSRRDFVNSAFSSMVIGSTFVLKGQTVDAALRLTQTRLGLIVVATLIALIAEIYFIGYSRVKNKSQRKLGQFMTKRLFGLITVTVATTFFLVYLFGFDLHPQVNSLYDLSRIVIVISMPCAVGAAIPSLLKQY